MSTNFEPLHRPNGVTNSKDSEIETLDSIDRLEVIQVRFRSHFAQSKPLNELKNNSALG